MVAESDSPIRIAIFSVVILLFKNYCPKKTKNQVGYWLLPMISSEKLENWWHRAFRHCG
jgi:hypothetical protein